MIPLHLPPKAFFGLCKTASLYLLFGLFMVGCVQPPVAPTPETPPIADESATQDADAAEPVAEAPKPRIPEIKKPDAVSFGLQEEEQTVALDDPWKLVEQANALPADRALGLQIRAVEEFLNQNRIEPALATLDALAKAPASPDDLAHVDILRARIMLTQDDPARALLRLQTIDLGSVQNRSLRLAYFNTLVSAQEANELHVEATDSLIQLHDLSEAEARLSLQQAIIEKIRSLNLLDQSLLIGESRHPSTPGWLSLAEALDFGNPDFLYADFLGWRKIYPSHPATLDALVQTQERYDHTEYEQIALLLPLTSDFGAAAQAFYDGFMDAASRYQTVAQQNVVLYDIGNSSSLSRIYYRAAIDDGADLVIGPLGRAAANTLLAGFAEEIDTLMITDIPEDTAMPHLFAFSLSPEEEARSVAAKAWADGHRQVTVFKASTPWGERVANAFIQQWESLGGIAVKNAPFPTDLVDYSTIIQKFLGIDKSVIRRKVLEAHLDQRLKFSPRRNEDMDFIFLAANSTQARIVVPQLRFFQAHDLPIYATSYVYSGIPSPELDADLDEVIFPDMRWVLQGVELYRRQLADRVAQRNAAEQALPANRDEDALETDSQHETIIDQDPDFQLTASDAQETESTEVSADPETAELPTSPDSETTASLAEKLPPYRNSALDRIYALGLQSYFLAPRLNALKNDQTIQYSGPAMTVSLAENGEVVRHPMWLAFRKGLPELERNFPDG